MNSSSYKIYLTKSSEAAHLISQGLRNRKHEGAIATSSGPVGKDVRIPEIYHDKGLFYALLEYKNGEDWSAPKWELIIV